jgi:hypothetical protein
MTIQPINIGNVVNDGLGDDLRTAFEKVNANFAELLTTFTLTGANAQEVGAKVFKEKTGSILKFKNLISGTKIVVTELDNSIEIRSTQPEAFTSITTNQGIVQAGDNTNIAIQGGSNITVTGSTPYITVDTNLDLNALLLGFDFGPVGNQYTTALQVLSAAANVDFGTCLTPGPFNIDLGALV